MSNVFANYEQDYINKKTTFDQTLRSIQGFRGDQLKLAISQAEQIISSAQETLDAMELSSFDGPGLLDKMNQYKVEHSTWREKLKNASQMARDAANREDLFSSKGAAVFAPTSTDHREQFEMSTKNIDRAGGYLREARIRADETVDIAVSVNSEIESQNIRIYTMRDRLKELNETLTSAGRLMKQISRRLIANKLILLLIIFAIIGIILLILFFKFYL